MNCFFWLKQLQMIIQPENIIIFGVQNYQKYWQGYEKKGFFFLLFDAGYSHPVSFTLYG